MTTIALHQQLMNEAYNVFKSGRGDDYEGFVDSLDDRHRAAVILGNLNYQVENGGFLQWHCNGYSGQVDKLHEYLEAIATPASEEVAEMINEFQIITANLDGDDEEEDSPYDHLDSRYYQINGQLLADVESWLEKM
ncbi:MAG: hypothetical protein AB1861_20840 [Cyanobacteriota bacterium]